MSPVEWAVLSSLKASSRNCDARTVLAGFARQDAGALLPELQGEGGSSVSERNWLRSGSSGFLV